ncbi:MAG TPA: YciI family protein [Syntrophomonadaceae bacterium]|nr:YciI family protein [Syntrophomonadaceae bacterium]
MFCIIGTYIKPIEEVDAELSRHYEFLEKYFANGTFILAGRRIPRFGGIILCNAGSRNQVETILQEDAFYQKNIMEYQITEFIPTKYREGLEELLGQ